MAVHVGVPETLIPLCIVGAASRRAALFAKALRRFSTGLGSALGTKADAALRVTCVCDADAESRARLKRVLCGDQRRLPAAPEDLDAIAEYDAFDEVLVCEEFGDFLCSAVLVLADCDPCRSVAIALEALRAGKHVILDPWAPARTSALRWGGFDDAFHALWEGLRNGDDRAICSFVQPVDACARLFERWLHSETGGSNCLASTAISAAVMRPSPPDPVASRAIGTVGSEQTAWLRPLRQWLGGPLIHPLRVAALVPGRFALALDAEQAADERFPGAALVSWISDTGSVGDAEANAAEQDGSPTLSANYSIVGSNFSATLTVHLGLRDGNPGHALGRLMPHLDAPVANTPTSMQSFVIDELDAVEEEMVVFAERINDVQKGAAIATREGSVAQEAAIRATYARLLQMLLTPADD